MREKINTLKIFFEEPGAWFHIRQAAVLMGASPASAKKYLTSLFKERFLIRKKERGFVLYKANEDSVNFKEYKKFYNILKLINSGLLGFLNNELSFPTIVVFGSYAKGEDFSKSDVDLFILSNTKKELDFTRYEKQINRKIQVFFMNDKEFERLKTENSELANNIINGIKVSGYLKVF